MLRWKYGISRGALIVSAVTLSAALPAFAAPFTVNNGQTVTATQNVTGTDTGTIAAGGTLATSGNSIVWSGAVSNVTIVNSGVITSSTARGFDTTGAFTSGSLTFTNNAGATITSSNDALRIAAPIGSGTVVINNYGTMTSTSNGRAIQLDANTSTTGSVTINNFAGGLLQSLGDQDAIRPGMNGVVNNYGTINAAFGTGDGIDFQDRTATVNNMAGGVITAAKHGINAGAGVVNVNNAAGGTIIGRNGSGVGSDNINAINAGTVVNYGRITGAYNGSGTGDGDGVDIDGAATITNYASGIIEGTGAGGFDAGNRANNSEGISIGGGTILNYGLISGASFGIVVNNDSNVTNTRSGVAATTLTNYGNVIGLNGFAVRFENKLGTAADNDTIVNYGTITGTGTIPTGTVLLGNGTPDPANGTLNGVTYAAGSARFIKGDGSAVQTGEGVDTLTNYGTIIGNTGRAINMEGGDDVLNIRAGSKIVGLVDGGVGNDTLDYGKVGLSAAKRDALIAGQTVNIGGTLYTSFETITGTLRSFSSFATTPATSGIATILDNGSTTQSAGAGLQSVIDQVASAGDVNGALAQLTPTAFQALTSLGVTNAFQTTQIVDQRLSNVRSGGLGFAMEGVETVAGLLNGDDRRGFSALAYSAPAQDPALAAFAKASSGQGFKKAPERIVDADRDSGMFIYGNTIFARQGATANAPESKFTSAGVTVGFDRRITPDFILGVLGGYTRTNADLDTIGSTSKIDTWLLGAYASYYRQNWFVNGSLVYGRNAYDNNRIAVGTSNTSNANGNQFAAQGSIGADFGLGRFVLTPEVGMQYTTVRVDGFTETGAAALNVNSDQSNSLRSNLGARLRTTWMTGWGMVTPEWRASWQHEFMAKQRDVRASFVDQALPGSFTTTAAGSGRDFGAIGTGLMAQVADRTDLSVNYDFKFGSDAFTAHQISGRLRRTF